MLCLQEDQWTLVFTGGSLNCVVFAGGSVDSCVYWRITELCCVCRRISELEGILTRLEDDTKNKVENATAQLHERTTEVAAAKLENERLKVSEKGSWFEMCHLT